MACKAGGPVRNPGTVRMKTMLLLALLLLLALVLNGAPLTYLALELGHASASSLRAAADASRRIKRGILSIRTPPAAKRA